MVSEQTKALAFATLLPGVGSVVGLSVWSCKKFGLQEFFKSSQKPTVAIVDENCLLAIDLATLVPASYAAYVVYNHGGFDYSDTKAALSAYAGVWAYATFVGLPAWTTKNWKHIWWATAAGNLLQAITMALFYRVDPKAGVLITPWVFWGHLAVIMFSHFQESKY